MMVSSTSDSRFFAPSFVSPAVVARSGTEKDRSNMNLDGKRVVVLGGTSGIGLAVARKAAGEGASIVIASSSQAKVDRALQQLSGSIAGLTIDLTQEDSIKSF